MSAQRQKNQLELAFAEEGGGKLGRLLRKGPNCSRRNVLSNVQLVTSS
jgi:hypothetical protein